YKAATGKTIEKFTVEQQQGKTTGFSAMNTACSALTVFVDAAKKAGTNLTYDSFTKAIESLGTFSIPETPVASFGPNKHDAQDSFQLLKFNPVWKNGSTAPQFLPLGAPITQRS